MSATSEQQIERASCHIHSSQHPTRRRATSSAHHSNQIKRHQVKLITNKQLTRTRASSNMASSRRSALILGAAVALALCLVSMSSCLAEEAAGAAKPADSHSTQASLERQVDQPTPSSPSASSLSAGVGKPAAAAAPSKAQRPISASQKKAAAAAASLASATNYDKYQLKASASAHSSSAAVSTLSKAQASPKVSDSNNKDSTEKVKSENNGNESASEQPASMVQPAHKKANVTPKPKSSSLALLKKFLPSFMTSAAAAAAAASAASSTSADKHANPHSRSSAPATSSSALFAHLTGDGPLSYASGKLVSLLSGGAKKRGLPGHESPLSAIPNHAPFFIRKQAADRQAGGGAVALASSLLSNPLKLGLLFSAPLLPSLLLTPLAIAGLSPAMSAINNFFGDDDEPGQPSSSPLAALASGPNSPLASILQATGVSPLPSQASGSQSASSSAASSSDSSSSPSGGNLALQAFQSLLLGPTSTTERPLFNPGVFGSSSPINNAMSSLGSSIQQAAGGSSSSSNSGRPLFGGSLIQTAASMISPSFAAPPSSPGAATGSASNDDDDGRGIMAMASDVFEKVANYMGESGPSKNIGQAAGGAAASSQAANSPLSTLASLSSLSPFQLSSLFAPTAFASALSKPSSGPEKASGSVATSTQRAGFFSTLRNVYELFSSSFLRRQEVGDSNECQQRLVCELHQRAMNSKLFRRSLQSNLMELAQLDRNLIEQLNYGSQAIQARVDPDTKAMLSDFLKATNNFKSGRELVNCGQMFPKCSRTQLLAAAHAHLNDPANGRTIGKFGQLMKKMKFKANQQHQSQWKLRKPSFMQSSEASQNKPLAGSYLAAANQRPIDHLQVAPLQPTPNAHSLAPVDSLKLAQQLMVLSQLNQQPQAQQQQINALATGQYVPSSVAPPQLQQPMQPQPQQQQYRAQYSDQQQQQQQASSLAPSYQPAISYSPIGQQYSPAPKGQTTYTDAVLPALGQTYANPTESPYFQSQQQTALFQPQQMDSQMAGPYSNQQQQQQQANQYQSSYQNYAPNYEQPQQAQPIVSQQQLQQPQQQQTSVQQEAVKQQTVGPVAKSAIAA